MHSLTCMSVVVCVVRKPHPCNSYSRRSDRINSVLWRSYFKGVGGYHGRGGGVSGLVWFSPDFGKRAGTSMLYVVIPVFFFAVNACNKKIVTSCIFFCGKSCKPATHITAKKIKIIRFDDFLYTRLPQKTITRLDDFFVHDLPQKNKITQRDNFFVHDLLHKKFPILPKTKNAYM